MSKSHTKATRAKTTPKSAGATVNTIDVMFRGVPKPVYQKLKMKAAAEGIYLKQLIIRILTEGVKAA